MAWVTKKYGLDQRNIEKLTELGWSIVQQSTKKGKVVTVLNVPNYPKRSEA